MKLVVLIIFCVILNITTAQIRTQTIRGTVIDATSGSPIPGVIIEVNNSEPRINCISQNDGTFTLNNVQIGRWNIEANFLGYNKSILPNISIISGKETFLTIKLEEKVTQLDDVVVRNSIKKEKALNDMALVSARTFSKEETERFAGSFGDPARMVANYAGVMAGDDSRNDIVIRGNSPLGVLWRLEGMDIPNPNHFGAQGNTGGAVSMLNSNLLTNSDFITGAFPAEYGNGTSGVFDLNLRSGNNSKYEYTGQVGFNGFEAATEGPIPMGKEKQKGSFLIDYRYSTMDLMNKMGMDFGTGTAIPQYQDLSAIIDLPTKKAGRFKLIGLFGKSKINLGRSFDKEESTSHSDIGTAIDFGSNLAFSGLTHTYFFNKNTKLKTCISYYKSASNTVFDTVDYENKKYFTTYSGTLEEQKIGISTMLKHKLSAKDNFMLGVNADNYITAFSDSSWNEDYQQRIAIRNANNKKSFLLKAYGEYQHKFTDAFVLSGGIYSQYYELSKEFNVEPRASAKWNFTPKQSINFGYGLHSQIQSRIIYYDQTYDPLTKTYEEKNHNLRSTKAQHFVLGYDNNFIKDYRFKIEGYFQYLYDVPVSMAKPQYSMLNMGAEYYLEAPDSIVNKGKGMNYGVEITFEKFLSNGFYFLLTGSIFDSKYQGYDNVWRNTAFNTNYVFNFLGGYEWKLSKKNFLTFDLKTVWSGGRRYSPVNLQESINKGYTVYDEAYSYINQFNDYFRTDLRIGYKINGKKMTQEIALDLENISNHENIFSQGYDKYTKNIKTTYQQGFMPMMLYRINF